MEDESPRVAPAASPPTEAEAEKLSAASLAPFGPGFFLEQLGAFARERCPSHLEPLPSVLIHLATGDELRLCHVMGLAPSFVALAIHDETRCAGASTAMRTELVPYSLITRVTIRRRGEGDAHVGFDAGVAPRLLAQAPTPEELLAAAARTPRQDDSGTTPGHDPERW